MPIFKDCSSVSESSTNSEEKRVENSTNNREFHCDEIQFTSFNYDDETTVALSSISVLSVGNALEDIEVYNVTEDMSIVAYLCRKVVNRPGSASKRPARF